MENRYRHIANEYGEIWSKHKETYDLKRCIDLIESRWSNTEHEIFRKNGHGRISPYQSYSKLLWEHFLSKTCVLIMFLIKKNP